MSNFKFVIIPPHVSKLHAERKVSSDELVDSKGWSNIFSGDTVKKLTAINSYHGGGYERNESMLTILGLDTFMDTPTLCEPTPPNFNFLSSLMPDGREAEALVLEKELSSFGISFSFVRMLDNTYLILLNELHEVDTFINRYVKLRINMGELIDDMSSLVNHDDIVCESILQSYMTKK